MAQGDERCFRQGAGRGDGSAEAVAEALMTPTGAHADAASRAATERATRWQPRDDRGGVSVRVQLDD